MSDSKVLKNQRKYKSRDDDISKKYKTNSFRSRKNPFLHGAQSFVALMFFKARNKFGNSMPWKSLITEWNHSKASAPRITTDKPRYAAFYAFPITIGMVHCAQNSPEICAIKMWTFAQVTFFLSSSLFPWIIIQKLKQGC